MRFKQLKVLVPQIDDAFEKFYDVLLKEARFALFFENDEQVYGLIARQKQHFEQMLDAPSEAIEASYIRVGEYHYDLRIPYVDFIRGTEILEEHFLLHAQGVKNCEMLMREVFGFFRIVKSYTAKGYLNRMIEEDKRDIHLFFDYSSKDEEPHLPVKVTMQKIEWLKKLLHAIENNLECDPEQCQDYFGIWLEEAEFLDGEKRSFFEDLEKRIQVNTQTLFYFLKKGDYLEILPLYTSLLSVYKLTLLLNNSITFEYAKHIISDLKIDKLTNLYRKDAFEQFLHKELELSKRDRDYRFTAAFIDIDDFKGINDRFGHYSGDKVLEQIGMSILKNIRASDIGFRIGGDEFALILKHASAQEGERVCRKILEELNAVTFRFNDDVTFSVGLSIGIADNSEGEISSIIDLVKCIDKKLYKAKELGKNRIVN